MTGWRSTMWSLRSLFFRTDLALTEFDGEVIDRGRYLVLRTPSNPSYQWGNFLLYPEPPDAGSRRVWLDDHARELPGVASVVLSWDRPDGALGEVEAFVQDGFAVDDGVVLTASAGDLIAPARSSDTIVVAPLETEAHWREAARALTNAFAPRRSGTLEDLRTFVVRQLERYRAMQAREVGQWYGAFVDGELAGTLGLVRVDGELGRFQLIGTDPRFGRRGVCSTLVYRVAHRALEEQGFTRLIMATDGEYHAANVYESVGFRRTERLFSLIEKRPTA